MKSRTLASLAAACCLALPVLSAEPDRSRIDLALCLDTSNSMDGLIGSAKLKLWAIVNELARAKPTPALRVALLSYGNTGYEPGKGWVRKDLDFTSDLDQVFAVLNALTTNGGEEYVARVVQDAAEGLDWTESPSALKLVFVAGNEAATQDPECKVPEVFKRAIAKGIQVNTIYCGSPGDPDAAGWREAAGYADGQYAVIDQDRGTVVVNTPMDKRLEELSARLNTTYLAFGSRGRAALQNQAAQDGNARALAPAAAAERCESKAGALYEAGDWDLVDALEKDKGHLRKVKDEELPEEVRRLPAAEREAYVAGKAAERKAIQEEVRKLAKERDDYVKDEMKQRGEKGAQGFDEALRKALREHAERKGIRFE